MILDFKRFHCIEIVECCEINLVSSCCKMLDIFATKENGVNPADEVSNFIVNPRLCYVIDCFPLGTFRRFHKKLVLILYDLVDMCNYERRR